MKITSRFDCGIYLVIAAMALSGCVTYSIPVLKNESPDPKFGYLLGRFTLNDNDIEFRNMNLGIRVVCSDCSKDQLLHFNKYIPGDVMAIRVVPGTYTMADVVFTAGDDRHKGEEPIKVEGLRTPFKVSAGKMYYLGDFKAEVKSTNDKKNTVFLNWHLKSHQFNPIETQNIFFREHPEFKNIQVVEPFINNK